MSKILVVDDERISALAVACFLEDRGFSVQIAGSGTEALQMALANPPDVLVSDWKLQDEIDGLELNRRLTAENKNLKTIIISGLSSHDVPDEDAALIFRFLTKPCGITNVYDTIQEALGEQAQDQKTEH